MEFLEEIYDLSKIGDAETATLKIFDSFDCWLIDGKFEVCDNILKAVDVDRIDTKLMRSFLCSTFPAKDKLPSRESLYQKIEAKMLLLRGEEKTRRILANLQ